MSVISMIQHNPKPYEMIPIGSIIMLTISTSPATLLGGGKVGTDKG